MSYILIAIIVLAVIGAVVFALQSEEKRKRQKISALGSLAFAFVLAGIVFGENRLIGYSLMGTGVVLAVVDMFRKLKK